MSHMKLVEELMKETGKSLVLCNEALNGSKGDYGKAKDLLNKNYYENFKTYINVLKQLSSESNMGLMDCRMAYEESKGDFNKALTILNERKRYTFRFI